MVDLSIDRFKERIQTPKNRDKIEQAIKSESRVKLHTETTLDASECGEGLRHFLRWASDVILNDDIFPRFQSLLQPPFSTLSVTKSIFSEHKKVFHGQNRFFKFEFKNSDYTEDFSDYRITLNDEAFFKTKGFEAFKSRFNSFIVIDFPSKQTTSLPEPYFYLLDINNVWDVEYTSDEEVEFIIIHQGDKRFLCIDSERYLVIDDEVLVSEKLHDFKYCPVKDLRNTRRISTNKVDKKSNIVDVLSDFDWLLFFETAKKYLDLYAPFPIYSAYESKCDHSEGHDNVCDNGIMSISGFECGKCKGKGKVKIGVGAFITVPAPATKDDPDMRNPVQVLPAEINSLTYNTSEVERLKDYLFMSCVGKGGEPNNNQAQNEKQVQGAFESKINILTELKEDFETTHKWILDTICVGRYGESFINSTVSYGDISYLETITDLNNDYNQALSSGKPVFELAKKRERINNTESRNNSDELLRTKILESLEPWQSLSFGQIKTMGLDRDFPSKFTLKVNFDDYIKRFEREQTNILMFGANLDFSIRISKMMEVLNGYVQEELATKTVEPQVNNQFNRVA